MYLLILSIREETLGIATRIVRERIVQFCIPYHISAPSKQRYIVLLGLLCFLLLLLIILILLVQTARSSVHSHFLVA